jgi:hypothetical protein
VVSYVSYGDDGTKYELVITEAATGRAAYNPKSGDKYTLTITFVNGDVVTSSGTVSLSSSVKIILIHSSGETVTVELTSDGMSIKSFDNDIPIDTKATSSGNNNNQGNDNDQGNNNNQGNNGNGNKVKNPGELNHPGTPGLVYDLINNGTAYSVRKGTVTETVGEVIIPAYYNGKPVTEIGITSNSYINYPHDYGAFVNTNITSVTIGANVMAIGHYAFSACTSLTSVTIPSGVTPIGGMAFESCSSLTNVTIGAGVTSIGDRAFEGCTSLTSVTIPSGVTSIGRHAFAYCTSLTSITVAAGNLNYASEGGILYNKAKTTLIQAPPGAISGSVIIPSSVTTIGDGAFARTSLTSVTIPTSVTTIGTAAFADCAGLTSVTIPTSVTTIGDSPFSNCESLINITVTAGNPNYASQDGILYNNAKTQMIQVPDGISGSVTIPAGVTEIGSSWFSSRRGLVSVTFVAGSQLLTIGPSAFSDCTSLTSVTIPASVTFIGEYAFSYCRNITSITIPASVTYLYSAFSGWTASQTINVPFANQAAADAAWGSRWRVGCNAVINYNG